MQLYEIKGTPMPLEHAILAGVRLIISENLWVNYQQPHAGRHGI
jgi:hypothetical protein